MRLSKEELTALQEFIKDLANPQSTREFLEGYCDDLEYAEGIKPHPLRKALQKLGMM